ncbi:MAG: TRAP transporter large permease subunit [Alphaproteobacteria bacterium]
MPSAEILDILMFATACGFILMGFPVAFTLAGTALIFAGIGFAIGVFDWQFVQALTNRIFGNAMWNEVLIAVPLFVFMGVMLEKSKVAEELLETMGALFGSLRGGLGISVAVVGMLLAASTGIVGATVVTMGLMSLPTMLKRGYDPALSCGMICAAGTLGQIIPPSIVLVILGDQLSYAYVDAQRNIGNWSPEPISVGDLFAAALLPGLMLVGLYILYQIVMAIVRPSSSPAIEKTEHDAHLMVRVMHALLPPVLLIVAVLGSILAGVATPTEAAAVGGVGSLLLAGIRVKELKMPLDHMEPEGRMDAFTRQIGVVIGGGLSGLLLGSLVFQATLIGLFAGIVLGFLLGGTGILKRFLFWLDGLSGAKLPIYMAALALIVILLLHNLVDMRMGLENVSVGSYVALGLAIIACIVMSWGVIISLYRVWATGILTVVNRQTMEISSMVFVILIGAALFSLVFRGLGGEEMVHAALNDLPGGIWGALLVVMLVIFILGFFLDFIEITFVVVPMVVPVLLSNDVISPIWIGILIAMNLQTSFLTPPFGFSLFYLRGVAPKTVTTMQIYRGVLPFVMLQVLALLIVALFPELANWLPRVIFGTDFRM